jgi:hypothetical protein
MDNGRGIPFEQVETICTYLHSGSNIETFKNRFNELIQYSNKMRLQTLVNLTLLKLDKEIEEGLTEVRRDIKKGRLKPSNG